MADPVAATSGAPSLTSGSELSKPASPSPSKRTNTQTSLSSTGKSGKKGRRGKEQQEERQAVLAFKILTEEETKEIMSLENEELSGRIAAKHGYTDHPHNIKSSALLDYYLNGVLWMRESGRNYSPTQFSTFYSVMHLLLTNIQDRLMNMDDNLNEFRKLLAGVDIQNPSPSKCGGLDIFNFNQATEIVDYFNSTLFQHYSLYEFLFVADKKELILDVQHDLEVPERLGPGVSWPAPLTEAIPEDMYARYIAPPPPPRIDRKDIQRAGSISSTTSVPLLSTLTISGPAPPSSPEKTAQTQGSVAGGGVPGEGTFPSLAGAPGAPPGIAVVTAPSAADQDRLQSMFSLLTPEAVRQLVNDVCSEMLRGLETEVANKLREKENVIVARINKIHNVANNPNTEPAHPTKKGR